EYGLIGILGDQRSTKMSNHWFLERVEDTPRESSACLLAMGASTILATRCVCSLPKSYIRPESFAFTLLLSAIGAIAPLSIDMGLPALSGISHSLGVPQGTAALTLSLFMIGFGIGPMALGPLSDRYGRKPVLVAGLSVFVVSGILCAAANSIGMLLVARLVQGAGAGSGVTLIFAIVRDLFEGAVARARLSHMSLVLYIAPMIAPTLGVWVAALGGWRAIYAFLAVAGVAVLTLVTAGFRESNLRLAQGGTQPLLASYGRFFSNRISVGYSAIGALSFGCIFAYVSGSPFVLLSLLHVSPNVYGLVFAFTSSGLMAGALVNGRLSSRGVAHTPPLVAGLLVSVGSTLALVALTLLDMVSLASILPFFALNTFAIGLLAPNATHGALHPVPEIAGVASALLNLLRMMCGALASALVAFLYDGHTALAMTGSMAGFALASLAVYLFVIRSAEREPHRSERELAVEPVS
ncbi:MAG: multidrug effflux MFS transporter, partial [Candidatus Korobacteraceae bacterium]